MWGRSTGSPGMGRRLADDQVLQLAGIVGHHPASVLGYDHRVGMPEPAEPFHVDPGLDGEHHARFEHGFVAAVEERRLVTLEADRMADVVPELVLHAELFGQPDRRQLDLADGHAW